MRRKSNFESFTSFRILKGDCIGEWRCVADEEIGHGLLARRYLLDIYLRYIHIYLTWVVSYAKANIQNL